ncbi:MAG: oligopeptidase B, partial [Acidimicrobiales bacterium]
MPSDDAPCDERASAPPSKAPPPAAERRPVELTAHGDTRTDPWYWLRDRDDSAVMSHLEAENSYAAASTAHLESLVGAVYEEILARVQLTDVTYPETRAQWSYYRRTVEGLEHPISCR